MGIIVTNPAEIPILEIVDKRKSKARLQACSPDGTTGRALARESLGYLTK
jgi:hypothetical protein